MVIIAVLVVGPVELVMVTVVVGSLMMAGIVDSVVVA
ncbi:hypothetical protein ANAPC2_01441 [Anaplasma phagocytophilum]|nr:hypothetical protein ANAPC2_01441 [Anaplasma phagocytophilum]